MVVEVLVVVVAPVPPWWHSRCLPPPTKLMVLVEVLVEVVVVEVVVPAPHMPNLTAARPHFISQRTHVTLHSTFYQASHFTSQRTHVTLHSTFYQASHLVEPMHSHISPLEVVEKHCPW